ncbi:regulator of G-protein signaling 5-like isoform X2 [Seriola lalandi dorsalis]|uniref:regulator of G-protein signaling 5-like isoform X2 n=1 Tax=Seriola lalandi dorsalis TaxID=1841481 RepID=UPI000C6FA908|nr:regulator of G-protein signaling 5-like isoform X2 [Seriola lalandi dorsalis]
MPKLLFSRMRFYEIRDLMQNVKRPRRIDIVLNRKRRKDIQGLMVQKINDEPSPSKFSWQTGYKLHPTLENVLQDKKYLAAFHTFLQSEFSEENIEFWLACEDFKSTTSSDTLRWKAEEIYGEFIQPTACRECFTLYILQCWCTKGPPGTSSKTPGGSQDRTLRTSAVENLM